MRYGQAVILDPGDRKHFEVDEFKVGSRDSGGWQTAVGLGFKVCLTVVNGQRQRKKIANVIERNKGVNII